MSWYQMEKKTKKLHLYDDDAHTRNKQKTKIKKPTIQTRFIWKKLDTKIIVCVYVCYNKMQSIYLVDKQLK